MCGKQDWYWYSLINYCISNNAYIGCDPPDVGLPLSQQSPTEVPADGSVENVDVDPCGDNSGPVRADSGAVQSCIAPSFMENGFVENLGDVTDDEERLLQLDGPIDKYPHNPQSVNSLRDRIAEGRMDGPIDKYPHKPQSDTPTQSNHRSTATGSSPHDGIAEGTVNCVAETAATEASNKDMNHGVDEPICKPVITTENCVLGSVGELSVSPIPTADFSRPSVPGCLPELLSDEFDVAVADAVMAHSCDFESANEAVPAVPTNPPPPASVRPSVPEEAVNNVYLLLKADDTVKPMQSVNDRDVEVADTVVAVNCESFESVSDVPVIQTSLPPPDNASVSVPQESVNNFCDIATAGAENSALNSDLATGVVPSSISPALATIASHVPESVPEYVIADQLNRVTVDIAENAVSPHQGKLISNDAIAPSWGNASVRRYVAAHVPESIPEHGIVDQLNRATVIGIAESAVSPCQGGLISNDAIAPSRVNANVRRHIAGHVPESVPEHSIVDQLNRTTANVDERAVSLLSGDAIPPNSNNDSEPVVTRPFIHSANDAAAGISAAGATASVAGPLDPETIRIINSVERSLAARDKTVNKSVAPTSVAPTGVELQRKIVRQMEVGVDYLNSDSYSLQNVHAEMLSVQKNKFNNAVTTLQCCSRYV